MKYLLLLLLFVQIGLFTFGGGYTMFSLLEDAFVTQRAVLTHSQFASGVGLAFLVPGPVAKMLIFVGYANAGLLGSLLAVIGAFSGPIALACLASANLQKVEHTEWARAVLKGVAAGAVGIIFAAAWRLLAGMQLAFDASSAVVGFLAFGTLVAMLKFRQDPLRIIVVAGLVGFLASRFLVH